MTLVPLIVAWYTFTALFLGFYRIEAYRIQTCDSNELSKPPSWRTYRTFNRLERESSTLRATASTKELVPLHQQYVEDDIVFINFDPLNKDATATAQNDPAIRNAANYFHEVDCSGGGSPVSIASALTIPWDEMQLAFFQGDEVVDTVLKNTQEVLNIACEQIFQFHKSRVYIDLGKDSDRNSRNAMRTIKALVYWIAGRILNCAKEGMVRLDQNAEANEKETEKIKRHIETRIRRFAKDTVDYWYGMIRPKEAGIHTHIEKLNTIGSAEERVCSLWDYLNRRVFKNSLPEFADMSFSWYNMIQEDGTVLPEFNGELFRYLRGDEIALPGIAFPRELSNYESALGNCVFRSMVKLYCDIFGPSFEESDYAGTVITAFQYVESEEAISDRIWFSAIQSNTISQTSNLYHLLPSVNALDPLNGVPADINDNIELLAGIEDFPFMKNRFSFGTIKGAIKDTDTALELFDRSFRVATQGERKEVVDEIMRKRTDIKLDDGTPTMKSTLKDGTTEQRSADEKDTKLNNEAYYMSNLWKRDTEGNLTVPVGELQRALLYGDIDKFGNILSLAMTDLLTLKPVQLNGIQNKIMSLCNDALNQVRTLDTYMLNYSLTPEDHGNSKIKGNVESLNTSAIQAVLFVQKYMNRCLSHNGLFPLDNSFIRTRPLELLLKDANKLKQHHSAADASQFGSDAIKKEMQMKSVPFPQEYLNDAVAADDPAALKFLVSYYNYNLFGGRLPIDIAIRFEHASVEEYLSSHDDAQEVLRAPTIYLNPLIRSNKTLVARLILEECFNLFLRWCNMFNTNVEGRNNLGVTDIVQCDMARRMRKHVTNCIEGSGDWPFFFDELFHMAPYENEHVKSLKDNRIQLKGRSLNNIFRNLNTDFDLTTVLTGLVHRPMMTELWEKKILPIRHFINALKAGDYDIMYTILVNSSSIKTTCHFPISEINYIENKFKSACQIAHELDLKDGSNLGYEGAHVSDLVNIEAIKLVECAFDELREHATKHSLIASEDLTLAITEATNNLARCQPEEVDHSKSDVSCSMVNINSAGIHVPLWVDTKDDDMVGKYMLPEEHESTDECGTSRYHVNEEEGLVLAEAIYRSYNEKFFNNLLPADLRIRFVDDLKDLSSLEQCIHTISTPTIKLSLLLSHAKLIFLQMILQMINLSFMFSTHNVEMDCVRYFNVSYRSAFKVLHSNQQQYMKSRLLPISREARMKANANAEKHSKQYVKRLVAAGSITTGKSENSSLMDMEIDEFVDEVLDGREKARAGRKDVALCNPFEEYQALKSFAKHFINWKRTKMNFEDMANINTQLHTDERALQLVNNDVIRVIWSKFKFEHLEQVLKKMNMEMPLSKPLALNWYQHLLNEDQQFKMIKYLTLSSLDDENVFTILTKSGSCTPQEAMAILIKLLDPQLKTGAYTAHDSRIDPQHNVEQQSNQEGETLQDAEDNLGSESFSNELQSLMSTMDMETAETVNMLIDKLMRRNYSDAVGILSSHPKRSYLKEMVIKFLDVIRNNSVLSERQHIEILEFLRN